MMFCIIADWDDDNKVSRYNCVDTKKEAIRLVDRLTGKEPPDYRVAEMQAVIDSPDESLGRKTWASKEQSSLETSKQAPNAYYAAMPSVATKYKDDLHQASNWDADPVNKTVSFNTLRFDAELVLDQMSSMRGKRDQLLAASDKYVNPDQWASMSTAQQNAWSVYRQQLRDLPATVDDPADPTWPTQPESAPV
jgi:hypothetical protein